MSSCKKKNCFVDLSSYPETNFVLFDIVRITDGKYKLMEHKNFLIKRNRKDPITRTQHFRPFCGKRVITHIHHLFHVSYVSLWFIRRINKLQHVLNKFFCKNFMWHFLADFDSDQSACLRSFQWRLQWSGEIMFGQIMHLFCLMGIKMSNAWFQLRNWKSLRNPCFVFTRIKMVKRSRFEWCHE